MGYTHYWYRERVIKESQFKSIVDDFRKLLPVFASNDTPLAYGDGEGQPKVDYVSVNFNGSCHCGHPENKEIVIPWPEKVAAGIGNIGQISGKWFAGAKLSGRMCDGDCSYESVLFPRVITKEVGGHKIGPISHYGAGGPVYASPELVSKYFECCKTAFRPYDWAVTAFLVIAKHYLGESILVHSDGDMPQWQDAMVLCQLELGYGLEFKLDR